ncbi:hypothetical protein IGI04_008821 [Brassica rapa subsp. trilocularis]|uniref:Dol-P-Glc:Glc(2)Man(9)GlcNAc(2)-PP-Dol alpha-1,2-glucosyltransferase n=1 Tax=Brassica rapa subsp. trilocularis TaxID=1813537 RepID=A0ABQ7MVH8_BRACM|nr:hypothetical protein IGI04_008821 [Brassica rapa subsp. trilocularis]
MGKIAVAAITSLWVIPMSIIVNHIVPGPYMDEIFHVPQAQQYCKGNLRSWDPMITTPPGLYYLSLAHVASLFPGMLLVGATSQSFSEACSTSVLRSTNAVFAVLCGVLVFEIIRFLGPNLSDAKATLIALVMSLYPLHWFFTFLYYTDVASLTAFLAMYLACLRKRYFLSAFFGALAICIRQTNVVWMLFVACSGVLDFTLDSPRQKQKEKVDQDSHHQSIDGKEATLRSNLRKRKPDNSNLDPFDRAKSFSSTEDTSGLVYDVYAVISTCWSMKWRLLVTFSPFIVVVVAFGIFIIWNGGIVLGAKEDHVVSPHFAQIMYFSLVSALFTAPLHFSVGQLRNLLQELRQNRPLSLLLTLVALVAGLASVHYFSLAHPYLLADNRHYPFYLWRKIINAHWLMKYMLVPVYVYSWFSILSLLEKSRRKIWVLVYFLATCAVLVPTPLIEFRYYTIPFYIFMLHSCVRNSGWATWFLTGTVFVCINVFTMGMFLFRPFKWSHEDGVQSVRFLSNWLVHNITAHAMGKNLRQKVTCSPIQNHPGFMWGLFDILKHNHWRYIKKRLPHKRPIGGRRSASAGTKNEVNNTIPPDGMPVSKSKVEDNTNVDSGKRPNKPSSSAVKSKDPNSAEKPKKNQNSEDKSKNLNSEEKRRRTHSEIKRSVKALIKALVIEDKTKRKGRHHRSSTYPVQSNPKEKESLSEVRESSDNKAIAVSPSIGSLNPLYLMSEESSYSDSEEFKLENTPADESDHSKKKKEEARSGPKLNEDYDTSSSPRQIKACLDALNLIHMNRNFLLKVLQDPGSPLARHFQREQAFSSKTMTRSGSFPTHEHSNVAPTSPSIAVELKAVEKLADEDSSSYTRKRGKNHQVVIKRFKDLRQKIKHVINENKSEKHRITMDAVLDKVPRKYGFSKDLRQDILSQCSSTKKEGAKPRQIRRTSSLCGSVDRYLQLYEKSFQKSNSTKEKSKVESEEPALSCKIVPKILGRILSLPGTKSPYALKNEDVPDLFTTSSISMEQEQEQDGLDDISEISEDQSSEHEMPETEQDRETSTVDVETETKSLYESSVDYPTFDDNASESHTPRDLKVGHDPDTETCETRKQLESITAEAIDEYLQIEAQDKGKFNYVRDILEISGFNAPESLSMWQSDYQPLDPLVYEEMTTTATIGCMIQDPECSRNDYGEEEESNCNHLLLFDLINEVLIEIYERSYHYCPKPLSNLCRIHPMPVGYSVLKDVWVRINFYLRYKPHDEQSFDEIMSRDLRRDDGWMDLQFESECVGIEVEDLIFEELLEELLGSC